MIFQTRWAMSYLRGPLTREQIKLLQPPPAVPPAAVAAAHAGAPPPMPAKRAAAAPAGPSAERGVGRLGALGAAGAAAAGRAVLRAGPGRCDDARLRADAVRQGVGALRRREARRRRRRGTSPSWCRSAPARSSSTGRPPRTPTSTPADLETAPAGPATFGPLPPAAAKADELRDLDQGFRPLAAAGAGAAAPLRRGDRAVLAARRDRGGVPRPRQAGGPRGARRGEGAAAAEVRRRRSRR